MGPRRAGPPSPWLAVALLSAAALAYEVLLIRLFAIVYWHHFAHMIISLALLGYGASGVFLSFFGKGLNKRFPEAFTLNAVVFALAAPLCFAAAQSLPFSPLELAWAPGQWLWLGAVYLLLALPFFGAANAIALALWQAPERLHRVYAADLAGAGIGALGILLVLFVLSPSASLRAASTLGLLAAAVGAWSMAAKPLWSLGPVLLAALVWTLPASLVEPTPSAFKDLPRALQVEGATVVAHRTNPMASLTIVDNRVVPFRLASGLSPSMGARPPAQLAVFADGALAGPVTVEPDRPEQLDYLDALPSALPYHLYAATGTTAPRVLVLGGGNGEGVRQALHLGAAEVVATEQNPALVDAMRGDLADLNGHLFERHRVTVHTEAIREYTAAGQARFDLIVLDAGRASTSGLDALDEKHELTLEAFSRYLALLRPGGLVSIVHGLSSPPRVFPRLMFTAVAALEDEGIDPAGGLVSIRTWNTAALVLKKGDFAPVQLTELRAFSSRRSFDIAVAPNLERHEANRFNILPQPYLFDAARALLHSNRRQAFADAYKFDIQPATDDKPFAYHGLRWSSLPELLARAGSGTAAQLEWGYLTLVVTLAQAMALSLLFIVVPALVARRRLARRSGSGSTAGIVIYFAAVGLAFLFVEIAFVHSLQRLLHHPVLSVSAVLASFLVFAGLGSRFSRSVVRCCRGAGIWPLVLGIGAAALIPLLALPQIVEASAHWPLWIRFVLALGLVAPLSFLMGMPFPIGLARVADESKRQAALAWAVNGCASVVGAIAAGLTALAVGFIATVWVGSLLYLVAAASLTLLPKDGTERM